MERVTKPDKDPNLPGYNIGSSRVLSNQEHGVQGYNTGSTQIISNQEHDVQGRVNTSSWYKGHGRSKETSGPAQRFLRPELNQNWRKTAAQKIGPNDDDEDDYDSDEGGGVSIIPNGIRPGWVWGPTSGGSGTAVSTNEDKTGQGKEVASQYSRGSSIRTQRPFIPSNALLGHPPVLTIDNARRAVMAGIKLNPNYGGTLTEFHIANAGASALENCSVRVHGIHPDATIKDILDVVHTGRIFSVNRCPPEVGVIETAAADIVFLSHAAAEAFINDANGGILIRDMRIQVGWNRNRVKEPLNVGYNESRIIRVKGPEGTFSLEMLESLFRQYFRFELVDTNEWRSARGLRTFELAFESIHPQATWARRVFMQHFGEEADNQCRIWFGHDPCDNHERGYQNRLDLPWRRGEGVGHAHDAPKRQIAHMKWRE